MPLLTVLTVQPGKLSLDARPPNCLGVCRQNWRVPSDTRRFLTVHSESTVRMIKSPLRARIRESLVKTGSKPHVLSDARSTRASGPDSTQAVLSGPARDLTVLDGPKGTAGGVRARRGAGENTGLEQAFERTVEGMRGLVEAARGCWGGAAGGCGRAHSYFTFYITLIMRRCFCAAGLRMALQGRQGVLRASARNVQNGERDGVMWTRTHLRHKRASGGAGGAGEGASEGAKCGGEDLAGEAGRTTGTAAHRMIRMDRMTAGSGGWSNTTGRVALRWA